MRGPGEFPGDLVAGRGLLGGDRGYGTELSRRYDSILIPERRSGAAGAGHNILVADLHQCRRAEGFDRNSLNSNRGYAIDGRATRGVCIGDRECGGDGLPERDLLLGRREHQAVDGGCDRGGAAGHGVDPGRCIVAAATEVAQDAIRRGGQGDRRGLGLAGVSVPDRYVGEWGQCHEVSCLLSPGATGDDRRRGGAEGGHRPLRCAGRGVEAPAAAAERGIRVGCRIKCLESEIVYPVLICIQDELTPKRLLVRDAADRAAVGAGGWPTDTADHDIFGSELGCERAVLELKNTARAAGGYRTTLGKGRESRENDIDMRPDVGVQIDTRALRCGDLYADGDVVFHILDFLHQIVVLGRIICQKIAADVDERDFRQIGRGVVQQRDQVGDLGVVGGRTTGCGGIHQVSRRNNLQPERDGFGHGVVHAVRNGIEAHDVADPSDRRHVAVDPRVELDRPARPGRPVVVDATERPDR